MLYAEWQTSLNFVACYLISISLRNLRQTHVLGTLVVAQT
jgi:hypothetical protein